MESYSPALNVEPKINAHSSVPHPERILAYDVAVYLAAGSVSQNYTVETQVAMREKWEKFLLRFLLSEVDFAQYSRSPESFNKVRGKFEIAPVTNDLKKAFSSLKEYKSFGDYATDPVTKCEAYTDAPFAYLMIYNGAKGKEVISVVSFRPDFASNTLYVDQLQAGTTMSNEENSSEAWRARMKFYDEQRGVWLEHIMFEVAKQLARDTGMQAIGLRKPEANNWKIINTNSDSTTQYNRVAVSQGMSSDGQSEYFTLSLQ